MQQVQMTLQHNVEAQASVLDTISTRTDTMETNMVHGFKMLQETIMAQGAAKPNVSDSSPKAMGGRAGKLRKHLKYRPILHPRRLELVDLNFSNVWAGLTAVLWRLKLAFYCATFCN